MKKVWTALAEKAAGLLEVKSIVTLAMTAAMCSLIFSRREVSGEVMALFSGVYGSVITYFFTRKAG